MSVIKKIWPFLNGLNIFCLTFCVTNLTNNFRLFKDWGDEVTVPLPDGTPSVDANNNLILVDAVSKEQKAIVCLMFIATVLAVARGITNQWIFGIATSTLSALCMIAGLSVFESEYGASETRKEAYFFGWISCGTSLMLAGLAFLGKRDSGDDYRM